MAVIGPLSDVVNSFTESVVQEQKLDKSRYYSSWHRALGFLIRYAVDPARSLAQRQPYYAGFHSNYTHSVGFVVRALQRKREEILGYSGMVTEHEEMLGRLKEAFERGKPFPPGDIDFMKLNGVDVEAKKQGVLQFMEEFAEKYCDLKIEAAERIGRIDELIREVEACHGLAKVHVNNHYMDAMR